MKSKMPREMGKGRTNGGFSKLGWIVFGCVLLVTAGLTGVFVPDADASRAVNSNGSNGSSTAVGGSVTGGGSFKPAPKARDDRFSAKEDQKLTVRAPGVLRNDKGAGRLSATKLSSPRHGVLRLKRDGSFVYAPNRDYNGKDSFRYKAVDGRGKTGRATVTITVGAINDAPVAKDGVAGAVEGGAPIPIDLGALVSDKETADANLIYTIVSGPGPEQGELTGRGSTRTFDPAKGYDGSFDVFYTVTDRGDPDGCGARGPGCDTPETNPKKKVTVTVKRSNKAPVVTSLTGGPGTPAVDEGSAAYGYDFAVADEDPGDGFTVKKGFPDCGTGGEYVEDSLATTDAGGSFRCRFVDGPNAPTMRVQVNDGTVDSEVFTKGGPTVNNVRPTVTFDAYDPQTGANDATVGESTTTKRVYTFAVTDPGDDTFSIEDAFPKCGQNGTLSGTATTTANGGSFECVFPDGGSASNPTTSNVEIKVKDSDGLTDADNQVVSVAVANAAPSATFEAPDSVDEGGDINLSLTTASDPAGNNDAIEYRFKCGDADWTAYGAATSTTCPTTDDDTVTVKGQVRDEDGGESEEYQKTVTVGNVAPTITSVTDDGPKDEGSPVTVTVNASDPAGADDPLSYEFDCENDGSFGAASTQNTAECTYANAGGKTVLVRVSDGDGGSDTDSATVTVRRVNALPVAGGGTASMDEDASPITIDFADFASDEETADANVSYDISAPDPSKGTLTGTGSARAFTPADDFDGTVEILYTVTDRGDPDGCDANFPDCSAPKTSDQGKVTVTVRPVNDAPVLTAPASISVDEDVPTALTDTSASDVDAGSSSVVLTLSVPSGALTASSGSGVTVGGTASDRTLTGSVADINAFIAASGVEFTTAQDATADVTLTTAIDDGGNTGLGGAKSDAETTTIDVQPVNDAPVADDENFNGMNRAVGNTSLVVNDTDDGAPDPSGPQKTVTGDVLDGDVDPDGPGSLVVQAGTFSTADGGSVTIESDGDFTFYPKVGTSCTDKEDSFDYTISDQNTAAKPNTAGTDTGTVTVAIEDCVWYVDGSAAAPSAGTAGRSDAPFDSLAGVNGASDSDAPGQKIFVYDRSYPGGLSLENDQKLFSQRHGLVVPDGGTGSVTLEPPAPAGPTTTITGGLALASNNRVQGVHLGNASGPALSGTNVGTAIINTQTSGAINNQTGGAVSIDGGTLEMASTGVSSSGGTNNVMLNNVQTSGTVNLGGGTLSGASSDAFKVSGQNGSFGYSGSISNASTLAANIGNKTGGTVTLSGDINPSSAAKGISVSNNTGGTVNFSGANKKINTGTGTGVTLSNNGGATVNFANGGLDVDASGGSGFSATGGGTVNVTGLNNTIDTTTGTALNVAGTNIGSDDLTFKSISANGGASGIVLNGTGASGGLAVTGNSGTCDSRTATCSGGAIQNISGVGISLTNTTSASFARMKVLDTGHHGVGGTEVTNFSFTGGAIDNSGTASGVDDSNIAFNKGVTFRENNVDGAVTITGNNLSNPHYHGVDIFNWAGVLDSVNVSGNTLTAKSGGPHSLGSAIRLIARGENATSASVTRANLDNNAVKNGWQAVGIQAQGGHTGSAPAVAFGIAGSTTNVISISGNTLDATAADPFNTEGILALQNHAGQANFRINNNGTAATPIGKTKGTAISNSAFGNVTVTSEVKNNHIAPSNIFGSQGIGVGTSSSISPTSGGTAQKPDFTVAVENNFISQTDGAGILAVAGDASSLLKLAIRNNDVGARASSGGQSIIVRAGNSNGDNDVCLDISGNNSASPVGAPQFLGIGLRKQSTSPTVNAFGIEGMTATSTPGVESHVDGLNPNGGGTLLVSATSGFSNCSTAP